MPIPSSAFHRKGRLAIATASLLLGLGLLDSSALAQSNIQPSKADSVSSAPDDIAIRPFQVRMPDSALVDLRNRVLATR